MIGLLALAAILIVAFIPIERRAGLKALVPRAVMRNESFTASCLAILFMSATFFAALLYLPQFMQKQLGYSPLEAGVGILPFLATFALVSFVAGPLYNRLGAKPLAAFGAACITVAPFLFSRSMRAPAMARWSSGWSCSGSGSAASTRPRPRPASPRSTNRRPAWPAASSTCSRSPAARSAWG